MKIDTEDIDDITIFKIDGMITLGSEDVLETAFKAQIEKERTKVILDLTKVKYIDSIGIGQLAGGYTMLKDEGGELVLARTNNKIQTLLKVTGLTGTIRTFPTVTDALDAV